MANQWPLASVFKETVNSFEVVSSVNHRRQELRNSGLSFTASFIIWKENLGGSGGRGSIFMNLNSEGCMRSLQ
jgi:hypothetical protein